MAIHPLDLQVVLGQMDNVGKDYLRLYTAPRKDQLVYATEFEKRSQDIDSKVLDLPEEVDNYEGTELDPHDNRNSQKKIYLSDRRPMWVRHSNYKDNEKGLLIDIHG